MILPRPMIRAIQRGDKTQHRQPRKPATHPGKTIAVRPPGAPSDGTRIHIHSITPVRLGDLTYHDARAEGHRTTADYAAHWVQHHDKKWVADHGGPNIDPHALRVRFTERHAPKTVWLITFVLDTTQAPRLLAARPCPDYTTSPHLAATGEPEALTDHDHKTHVQDRADLTAEHYKVIQDANREALALHERLRQVQETAAAAGVDIRRQELSILNRIRSLESKVRKLAA